MKALRLVAYFGCFDRTYEGLKLPVARRGLGAKAGFDRTYEGLKQEAVAYEVVHRNPF